MEHITHTTTPDQLTKITIPSWCKRYVNDAICASVKIITIQEFIKATNFPIDSATVDILYLRIKEDIDIYLDEKLLTWMGYKGALKTKLNECKKLLKRNFTLGEDYTIYKNDDYKEYYGNVDHTHMGMIKNIYPDPEKSNFRYNSTHVLVKPDTFKAMSMMLQTSKGRQIRKYYISMEKLMKAYVCFAIYIIEFIFFAQFFA